MEEVHFGKLNDGSSVSLYTIANSQGSEIKISNYGGTITSIQVPDQEGKIGNVVLGYNSLSKYLGSDFFLGATIGRYGNRIAGARFSLDGEEYQLTANDGEHHLHGGRRGFHKVLWEADIISDRSLKLSYLSKEGEEGYPGNLKVLVTFTFSDQNELKIEYEATTDKATPVNLTNHSYFNLTGDPSRNILDHVLKIDARKYTPVDDELIPTGEVHQVEQTPFDYTAPYRIGERINQVSGGYDHNFILNEAAATLRRAAVLYDPKSGREMEVFTTEPGIQFYSGNFLGKGTEGPDGVTLKKHSALCLETQHFPNSPNVEAFPSTILNPGEKYHSVTVYKFSVSY